MTMEFDRSTPIYLQLMQVFRQRIVRDQLSSGDKIASVRELAAQFGVNPNTVQRALRELEQEGLIYTERTSGRYVTTDPLRIERMRHNLAAEHTARFLQEMKALGFDKEKVIAWLKKDGSEGNGTC